MSKLRKRKSVVLVYSPELEQTQSIPIPFTATAITSLEAGKFLIGGEGQIALLDRDGNILQQTGTPQIGDIDAYRQKIVAAARIDRKKVIARIKEDLELYQQQVKSLEKTQAQDRSRGQKRALAALQAQIELFKQEINLGDGAGLERQVESMLQMKLRVPAITASNKEIFVTLPSLEGFGFEVWRMDHSFKNARMIISDLRGCCGQMDVQIREDQLFVAENARFRVALFDRTGEQIAKFGKADRSSREGFGSCCNPMNVRCCANGDILTAESSVGNIKRFSAEGDLLANIGHVPVTGGCKNVAIEYDETRDRYFMMDLPNHAIHVLNSVANSEKVSLKADSDPQDN
ncbi:MAG: hypothetical protein R3C11_10020 [Planctomycetaceae bacterium]